MFKRIIHEDWAAIVPILSFILTAGVFVVTTIRAILLSKASREHLANLPLRDSSTEENTHS